MPRKEYDPLAMLPSPEAIRERLTRTLALAKRLRILLDVAERLRLADQTPPLDADITEGGNRE